MILLKINQTTDQGCWSVLYLGWTKIAKSAVQVRQTRTRPGLDQVDPPRQAGQPWNQQLIHKEQYQNNM